MTVKTYTYAELTDYTIFQANQQSPGESNTHCRERWTDVRRARRRRCIEGAYPPETEFMENEQRITYMLLYRSPDEQDAFLARLDRDVEIQRSQPRGTHHHPMSWDDAPEQPAPMVRGGHVDEPIVFDFNDFVPLTLPEPSEPAKPSIGEAIAREATRLEDEFDPKRDRKFLEATVGTIKADLERQRERRLLKQYVDREAQHSWFIDGVREAITPIEFAPRVEYAQYRHRPTEKPTRALVGLWSDLHAGKKTAHFNSEIAAARVHQVVEQTLALARKERTEANIDTYHMLLLGDLCDGAMIYPSQTWHSDQNVLNQIFRVAAPILAEAIRDLSYHFAEIHITCVPGNHGRGVKGAHEEDNADLYLAEALRLMTSDSADVHWHMNHQWYNIHDVLGTKILMVHGHQCKIAYSVPFYSLTRKALGWHSSMEPFDIAVLGHFHTPNHINVNDLNVIMNGAYVGEDDFALEVLAAKSAPAQTALVIDKDRGLIQRTVISLN